MPVSLKKLPKNEYVVHLFVESTTVQMFVSINLTDQTEEIAADTAVVMFRSLLTDAKYEKYLNILVDEVEEV
jgi:hypothetical protein